MAFMLSPGVHVTEKDLTNIIPAVSTSVGGFAGPFGWGPVLDTTTISSEADLLTRFGKPTTHNAASWFTAANFLSYTSNLINVRTDTKYQRNAVANVTGSILQIVVDPAGGGAAYNSRTDVVVIDPPDQPTGRQATATFKVDPDNGAVVGFTVTNPGSGYDSEPEVTIVRYPDVNGRGFMGYTQLGTGGVYEIVIDALGAGVGYDPAEDHVVISAPTQAGGVQATANFTVDGTGMITGFTNIVAGSGYTSAPTVTISVGSGNTGHGFSGHTHISRSVSAVVVSEHRGGEDYDTTNYEVVISAPDVPGVQATADFTVDTDGAVTGFTNIVGGSGYLNPPTVSLRIVPLSGEQDPPIGEGLSATAHIINAGMKINNETDYYNYYENTNGFAGPFTAKYPGSIGNSIAVSMADYNAYTNESTIWPYRSEFDGPPETSPWVAEHDGANDEMHVVVIDTTGQWTGQVGGIMERFAYVSKASDARRLDGSNNFFKNVINQSSNYLWVTGYPTTKINGTVNWGEDSQNKNFAAMTSYYSATLVGGMDDYEADDGDLLTAYDLLGDAEKIDVNLIMAGPASAYVAKYIIQNICERRKDCIAFASPVDIRTGGVITGFDAAERIVEFRNVAMNISSSYGVLDSGYKYQLDRYNDTFRWVPLNGDIAGLCARTDDTNDPWWSPGGLNRGQIKNVMKLAFNPNQTDRDNLYKSGINPVVSFPGQGVVLWGDKTLLAKPSAFDRINVRRLFIVLEKAIATAAKFMLFEFNDRYTRKLFVNMVTPYLRNIMGRRGIYDFRVICDDSNNTGEVIDSNSFVADIYIKPARSINFLYLNFIAVRTAVSFEEAVGY